jgi:hypothetical protein
MGNSVGIALPVFCQEMRMRTERRSANSVEGNNDHKQAIAEATEFHAKRIKQEMKIKANRKSASPPVGDDEYEQMIAENANFTCRKMIEEAAFFLAEQRGFAPGNELNDWFQAETNVENLLRSKVIDRRKVAIHDRRREASSGG